MNLERHLTVLLSLSLIIFANSVLPQRRLPRNHEQVLRLSPLEKALRRYRHNFKQGIQSLSETIDSHVIPTVIQTHEKLTKEVAPAIGQALYKAGNTAAIATVETIQDSSKFINDNVFPVVEDTFVEVGNAAVPVVNQGIDILGAGLAAGLNAVSRTTVKGFDRLGNRVLGEQRHSRIKTIANNISGGISSSLSSITGVIQNLNEEIEKSDDDYDEYQRIDYSNYRPSYPNVHYPHRDAFHSPIQYHHPVRGITRVIENTAYTISRHILGQNLTDAMVPLAKTVSRVLSETLPGFSDENTLPHRADKAARKEQQRSCATADGKPGFCQDLNDCPDLILNLTLLRKSVCFKGLFVPGVCCPKSTTQNSHVTMVVPPTGEVEFSEDSQTHINNRPMTPHQLGLIGPLVSHTVQTAFRPPDNNYHFHCGVPKMPTFRIVGGKESTRGEWPWMAAIFLHGPKRTEYWCGASLVSDRHVITAAHCTKDSKGKTFSPTQFTVRLGDHNIFSSSDDHLTNPHTYRVERITGHPDFKFHGFYNDVAILRLENKVAFTPYILPVCLPSDNLATLPLDGLVGKTPTVVGYGTMHYGGKESTTLQKAQLPVWRNEDCDDSYFQPITEVFLCAGYAEGGTDACQGDSGGPLQLYSENHWVQIGIVSFGNRCAEPGYPGVYTRITHFLPWIRRNLY